MADSDSESGGSNCNANSEHSWEHDRFLPIANVSRIMKRALTANTKISKDAKETVQECVSEFITGETSDKCQREKRKTINGDDLLWAMTTLGFEEYVEPLKVYLQKYRETEGENSSVGAEKEGGGCGSRSGRTDAPGSGSGDGFNGMGAIYGGMMMGHRQSHVYGPGGYHHMGGGGAQNGGTGGQASGKR